MCPQIGSDDVHIHLEIDHHVFVHSDPTGDPATGSKLDRLLHLLLGVDKKADILMALADDLKAGIAKLNDETDQVATNIANLAARIKNTLTDQEVADIQAALTAESDRLVTLAKDPTNPVPPAPGPLLATRAKAQGKQP
jgi:hypothetical protein